MPSIFLSLAQQVLSEEKKPLTPNQIWEIALSKGYDKKLGSIGKTPYRSLGAMLYVDVRDNPNSIFVSVGENPKHFYLKSLSSLINTEQLLPVDEKKEKRVYWEKDLHPFLSYFGFYYLNISVKTIQHSKSEKKEYGEWVHPDMVGCYFPYSNWQSEVVDLSTALANTAVKLYSFEIKIELRNSNLRESFFQAVSNSSWANEGYLVAAEIDPSTDFMEELKRLSTSFGIGVIEIDIEDPDSSQVLFPAKSKDLLDWETVNKLSRMNSDFRNFLKRVRIDISSKEVRKELYDEVLERPSLQTIIKK